METLQAKLTHDKILEEHCYVPLDSCRIRSVNADSVLGRTCPGGTERACEDKAPDRPACQEYDGTVWAMCSGQPYERWGVGPEGTVKAIGNCNYAYSNSGGSQYGSVGGPLIPLGAPVRSSAKMVRAGSTARPLALIPTAAATPHRSDGATCGHDAGVQ